MNSMRVATFVLIVSTISPTRLVAQELSRPEDVGLSAVKLERITSEAKNQVAKGHLVGSVSLVARKGKIVYLEAVGYQNREKKVVMETDTIFRVASFTKPVTSLAALMLYEEGKFQLTDPVSIYIPQFKDMKVVSADGSLEDAEREITVYDLLTHNAGLSYSNHSLVGPRYFEAEITNGLDADPDTIGNDVRKLAALPLAQQPGSGFLYGLSIDVLGHLVEVTSDQTLAEFFEERMFRPLGMEDTSFFLPERKVSRLAQLYVRDEEKQLVPENTQYRIIAGLPVGSRKPFEGPKTSYSGGGGLCSTCEDYFRFCQMVLQKGSLDGSRLLSRKTIEQATLPHVPLPQGFFCSETSDFGLGFAVQRAAGTPRPGSPGTLRWGSIFNGHFFIDPEEELIGITLGQLFPGEAEWTEKFMQLVYAAIDD